MFDSQITMISHILTPNPLTCTYIKRGMKMKVERGKKGKEDREKQRKRDRERGGAGGR